MQIIKVEVNELGEPVGANACLFANSIGTIERSKKIPLGDDDWKLVDDEENIKLFDDLQVLQYYSYSMCRFNYLDIEVVVFC